MTFRLLGAAAVTDPSAGRYSPDPMQLAYFGALATPFGETVDEQLLRSGSDLSHADLVDLLVERLPPGLADPDLVLVTYGLPDLDPARAVAAHLDFRTGGGAHCLAISEQGPGAPFTALRAAAAYEQAGLSKQFMLAVLEQTTVAHRDPRLPEQPRTESGALLVFGRDAGSGAIESVSSPGCRDELTALLARAAAQPRRTLFVFGPWLARDLPGLLPPGGGTDSYQVPAGSYCTGVWLALARHWEAWQAQYDAIVLSDTEPRTGRSHLAVLGRAL